MSLRNEKAPMCGNTNGANDSSKAKSLTHIIRESEGYVKDDIV